MIRKVKAGWRTTDVAAHFGVSTSLVSYEKRKAGLGKKPAGMSRADELRENLKTDITMNLLVNWR